MSCEILNIESVNQIEVREATAFEAHKINSEFGLEDELIGNKIPDPSPFEKSSRGQVEFQ